MDEKNLEKILENLKKDNDGRIEKEEDFSLWFPLFFALLSMNSSQDTKNLEKELSYLHGKVDCLISMLNNKEVNHGKSIC